ncbi:MAG TPA: hypothetical protein VKG21_15140 [Casimicrobiaceae bacterium]|nr:hypothetical protein [Casimicrobiaceae bacterium]
MSDTAMPGRYIDTGKIEGVFVESIDAELIAAKMLEVDWSRKRKTVPLNVILPSTLLWAGDLPKPVRPIALILRLPRIANLLAANWKDPTAFYKYLGSLLIDRRGGRQGFPSEIRKELLSLRTAYPLRKVQRILGVAHQAPFNTTLASPVETQSV